MSSSPPNAFDCPRAVHGRVRPMAASISGNATSFLYPRTQSRFSGACCYERARRRNTGPCRSARQAPNKNRRKSLCVKEMNECMTLAACPYSGVDLNWAGHLSQRWSPRKSVRYLPETDWHATCTILGVNHDGVDYVQDHAKRAPRLHSCRSSSDGCDESTRS